jgi:hypothetical protein
MPGKFSIFVDRSLGGHIVADALRSAGENVVPHDDVFSRDAKDEEWLGETGRQNWIAITKDYERVQSRLKRLTVARARARLFVLRTTAQLTGPQLAMPFVKAAPRMQDIAAKNPAPFIAKVYTSGEVHLWRDRKTLLAELSRSGSRPSPRDQGGGTPEPRGLSRAGLPEDSPGRKRHGLSPTKARPERKPMLH